MIPFLRRLFGKRASVAAARRGVGFFRAFRDECDALSSIGKAFDSRLWEQASPGYRLRFGLGHGQDTMRFFVFTRGADGSVRYVLEIGKYDIDRALPEPMDGLYIDGSISQQLEYLSMVALFIQDSRPEPWDPAS